MEHWRADLWDLGFGSAVSLASEEAYRRVRLSGFGCTLPVACWLPISFAHPER
jgi:hypothetical protein